MHDNKRRAAALCALVCALLCAPVRLVAQMPDSYRAERERAFQLLRDNKPFRPRTRTTGRAF